jgi:hypothetical protein
MHPYEIGSTIPFPVALISISPQKNHHCNFEHTYTYVDPLEGDYSVCLQDVLQDVEFPLMLLLCCFFKQDSALMPVLRGGSSLSPTTAEEMSRHSLSIKEDTQRIR